MLLDFLKCKKFLINSNNERVFSFSSRIAETPSIWLDSYYEWLNPTCSCCGHAPGDPTKICDNPVDSKRKTLFNYFFIFILGVNSSCVHCLPPGQTRPNSTQFLNNLYHFFTANPTTSCAAAGHAAYNSAVKVNYTLNLIESKRQ